MGPAGWWGWLSCLCLCFCLCLSPSSLSVSVCLSLCICLSWLSVCLSASLSLSLSLCLCPCLSHLSVPVCLSVCLSVCLFITQTYSRPNNCVIVQKGAIVYLALQLILHLLHLNLNLILTQSISNLSSAYCKLYYIYRCFSEN